MFGGSTRTLGEKIINKHTGGSGVKDGLHWKISEQLVLNACTLYIIELTEIHGYREMKGEQGDIQAAFIDGNQTGRFHLSSLLLFDNWLL